MVKPKRKKISISKSNPLKYFSKKTDGANKPQYTAITTIRSKFISIEDSDTPLKNPVKLLKNNIAFLLAIFTFTRIALHSKPTTRLPSS